MVNDTKHLEDRITALEDKFEDLESLAGGIDLTLSLRMDLIESLINTLKKKQETDNEEMPCKVYELSV